MDAYKPFVSLRNEYKSEYNETELNKFTANWTQSLFQQKFDVILYH